MAETQKFLDSTGLATLWGCAKSKFVEKETGKGLSTEDFTTELKNKLDKIEAEAEVNQNAFSNVKVGTTTIASASKTDTVELVAGDNVTLTPDATAKKVTVTAKDTTYVDATQSASGLMSATDKKKLDELEDGAEVNIIESIKVNGTAQTVTDKSVDIKVPTNNNELTNGAGYQTEDDVDAAIKKAIAGAYIYKGSVAEESKLPATGNTAGDVYNIVAASSYGPAGMNVAWTGTAWDALGASISVDALTADDITAICV